ncbi:MAG: ABC transporter ATP-binding protein [Planctomycetota bacterium]
MPTSSDRRPRIETHGLGKCYRLGDAVWDTRIGRAVGRVLRTPLRVLGRSAPAPVPEVWALKDFDLEVAAGEVLGIIGANGAGKSTLLKLLSRITEPTEGRFTIRGRTASLLQVGVGFHGDLTGRENVYLSGTILGLRKREIDRRFDEIVAFAGVETFLDTPVKRYSTGMVVRLGFAVAAHLEAEVLLVDEVLAVGDAAFRTKCLGAMDRAARGGRTVLLVSHDLAAIRRLSSRVLLLEKGRSTVDGPPAEAVARYLEHQASSVFRVEARPGASQILEVEASPPPDTPSAGSRTVECFPVRIRYALGEFSPGAVLRLAVLSADGLPLFETATSDGGLELPSSPGAHEVRVSLPGEVLRPGRYHLAATLVEASGYVLDRREPAIALTILPSPVPDSLPGGLRRGTVYLPCRWEVSGEGAEPSARSAR